jgi:hypothetical protein
LTLLSLAPCHHRQYIPNWWLKEEDFHGYAKNCWTKNPNMPFVKKMTHLASSLKVWCRKKKPLQEELHDLEKEIEKIQLLPLDQQDHTKEASLVLRYEQAITKLNDSYLQRAKKNWAKDGDGNTAYFHRSIAKRRRKNTIFSIKDEHNLTHFMPDKITSVFTSYFRSIFSTLRPGSTSRPIFDTREPLPDNPTYSKPDKQEI